MKAISIPKDKYKAEEERQLKLKNSNLETVVKGNPAVQKKSKGKDKDKGEGKERGKSVKQKTTDMRTSVSPAPMVRQLFCCVTRTTHQGIALIISTHL